MAEERRTAEGDAGGDTGLVEGLREVPAEVGRAVQDVDARLEQTMKEKPLLDNVFDWRLVLLAGAVALVLGAIVRLLFSPLVAVIVFLIAFLGIILVIAARRTGD